LSARSGHASCAALPVQHIREPRTLSAGRPQRLGARKRQALTRLDAGLEHPPLGKHLAGELAERDRRDARRDAGQGNGGGE